MNNIFVNNAVKEMEQNKKLAYYYGYISNHIGELEIIATEQNVIAVNFIKDKKITHVPALHPLIEQTRKQLIEYFNGQRDIFDLPLKFIGTTFQQKVWQALNIIAYGETLSYQQLAIQLGNEKAVRAVANAIAKNPLLVLIPCHRVIGKNGQLTGYVAGLEIKQKLLILEDKFKLINC